MFFVFIFLDWFVVVYIFVGSLYEIEIDHFRSITHPSKKYIIVEQFFKPLNEIVCIQLESDTSLNQQNMCVSSLYFFHFKYDIDPYARLYNINIISVVKRDTKLDNYNPCRVPLNIVFFYWFSSGEMIYFESNSRHSLY